MPKLIDRLGKLVMRGVVEQQRAGDVMHSHRAWVGVAERGAARPRGFLGARLFVARAPNQQKDQQDRRCTFEADSHITAITAALVATAAKSAAWFASYRSSRRA